jgi:hypothetical protein
MPELEVVWPLDRWHYLSPSLYLTETDMADDVIPDMTPLSYRARDLAARALLAGAACTQQRVSELLETSRRSVGRAVETDLGAAMQDAAVVAEARAALAGTARCGSTAEEREAAERWLVQVLQDDHAIEIPVRRPTAPCTKREAAKATLRPSNGTPADATFPRPQLEALERQQQRHPASDAGDRLRVGGRAAERGDAHVGRRAGRVARRHHRGRPHDRDHPARHGARRPTACSSRGWTLTRRRRRSPGHDSGPDQAVRSGPPRVGGRIIGTIVHTVAPV